MRTEPSEARTSASYPGVRGNPMLDAFVACEGRVVGRADAVARYAFATPTDDTLAAIASAAPDGVVELGAGTGYWARMLSDQGVDVVAYDLHPPPSPMNRFYAGVEPWHPVEQGDASTVLLHPRRLLLMVWPTKDEEWPAVALDNYHAAGGRRFAFVGEPAGGRTGDDVFHALLGAAGTCLPCGYGVLDAPCTCDVRPRWALVERIALPHWGDWQDDLYLYARVDGGTATLVDREW